MKVAILAGGLGNRLSEETAVKPKSMVEIRGWPILWHIMKIYASFGFTEFVIALGYKGDTIKDYFLEYRQRARNLTIKLKSGEVDTEDWTVHPLGTGIQAQNGERIRRVKGIYNICPSESVTIRHILETIVDMMERSELIRFGILPNCEWNPAFICCDNRKLVELGWKPHINLQEA